jgi:hypothetical protein
VRNFLSPTQLYGGRKGQVLILGSSIYQALLQRGRTRQYNVPTNCIQPVGYLAKPVFYSNQFQCELFSSYLPYNRALKNEPLQNWRVLESFAMVHS